MKKIITTLFCSLIGGFTLAQWTPTTFERKLDKPLNVRNYYKLDLDKIKTQLSKAEETGKNAKPVEVSLPTLEGKIEKFAVYSFPVVVKELADQYQLGSYVGVGIDDPTKYIRFSVAPNHFQSMIIKNGVSEFIEPIDKSEKIYGVHPPTDKGNESFSCSTKESLKSKQEIEKLYKQGKAFTNQLTDFSRSSDKKYRTMRLAVSVTGEYTQYHGGTVADAFAAVNATMTIVNGIFEKDFALHLNVQNLPSIIYVDPNTDPYSGGNLNLELQQTLTSDVGNVNYDIGHLFVLGINNGNAGCIGCVCTDPTVTDAQGKGSGFSSNYDPAGNGFDLIVAHEMGHQLGATHTFSSYIPGNGTSVEPGSGSTIMGYAGTFIDSSVQPQPDPYFHTVSIKQIQENLSIKNCDIETLIINTPPTIATLSNYIIPKQTAFVLSTIATDAENDPLSYTWEQIDNALTPIETTTGNNTTGALFRSLPPTSFPSRYFPKLSSVLNGNLVIPDDWEAVPMVPRITKFSVTVRDNNTDPTQQQTQSAEQYIIVGNDGPFKVITQYANVNASTPIEWDKANTNNTPYNVSNVKIDYTTDNGTTWTVLSSSTLNDGIEDFIFPSSMNGQVIKVRVSAIDNVFYAIGKVHIVTFPPCNGAPPIGITVDNITNNSADISWIPTSGASSYNVRYKKVSQATWQQATTSTSGITLQNLNDGTYEIQVAAICSGITGTYSASLNFSVVLTYCSVSTFDNFKTNYISNLTLANISNTTNESSYTDYSNNPSLQVNLIAGSMYTLSVTKAWLNYDEPNTVATTAWIDFNRNGIFEDFERILNSPSWNQSIVTSNFIVPVNAITDQNLRMRVGVLAKFPNDYIEGPCGAYNQVGEFEDYSVVISPSVVLATNENSTSKDIIQLYPNPVTDILKVSNISDKATYKIYSAAGQLVTVGSIKNKEMNVSSLLKGTYFISIEEKGKDLFKSKFIKE